MFFRVLPESFRWLVSCQKFDEAKQVVIKMSKYNNTSVPNMARLNGLALKDIETTKYKNKYSMKDLFLNVRLRKVSIILAINW